MPAIRRTGNGKRIFGSGQPHRDEEEIVRRCGGFVVGPDGAAVETHEHDFIAKGRHGRINDLPFQGRGLLINRARDPAQAIVIRVTEVAGVFVLQREVLGSIVEERDIGTAARIEAQVRREARSFIAVAGDVSGGAVRDELLRPVSARVTRVVIEAAEIG